MFVAFTIGVVVLFAWPGLPAVASVVIHYHFVTSSSSIKHLKRRSHSRVSTNTMDTEFEDLCRKTGIEAASLRRHGFQSVDDLVIFYHGCQEIQSIASTLQINLASASKLKHALVNRISEPQQKSLSAAAAGHPLSASSNTRPNQPSSAAAFWRAEEKKFMPEKPPVFRQDTAAAVATKGDIERILNAVNKLDDSMHQQFEQLQSNLLIALGAVIHSIKVPGPYVYMILPETRLSTDTLKDKAFDIWSIQYRVRFLCQYTDGRLCLNTAHAGYTVRFTKQWVIVLVKVLKVSLVIASVVLMCMGIPPVLGAVAGALDSTVDAPYSAQIAEFMKELTVDLKDAKDVAMKAEDIIRKLLVLSEQLATVFGQNAVLAKQDQSKLSSVDPKLISSYLQAISQELTPDNHGEFMKLINTSNERETERALGIAAGGLEPDDLHAGDRKLRWCCPKCLGRDVDLNDRLTRDLEKEGSNYFGISTVLRRYKGLNVTRLVCPPAVLEKFDDKDLKLAASLFPNLQACEPFFEVVDDRFHIARDAVEVARLLLKNNFRFRPLRVISVGAQTKVDPRTFHETDLSSVAILQLATLRESETAFWTKSTPNLLILDLSVKLTLSLTPVLDFASSFPQVRALQLRSVYAKSKAAKAAGVALALTMPLVFVGTELVDQATKALFLRYPLHPHRFPTQHHVLDRIQYLSLAGFQVSVRDLLESHGMLAHVSLSRCHLEAAQDVCSAWDELKSRLFSFTFEVNEPHGWITDDVAAVREAALRAGAVRDTYFERDSALPAGTAVVPGSVSRDVDVDLLDGWGRHIYTLLQRDNPDLT